MNGFTDRRFRIRAMISSMGLGCMTLYSSSIAAGETRPNVIIILADDMGYADPVCFGGKGYKTPNLDRLAKEGVKFTDFYVSSPVCSASRAALMTGCYNERVSIRGALGPKAKGMNPDEETIAEVLKKSGYATGMAGKWHLGDKPSTLPVNQGFDEYYGLAYSNDMWPYHPETKEFQDLPLFENNRVVNPKVMPEDQKNLTRDYTKRAVDFITKNKERPFFFYLAHSMVHVPLFVSEEFEGKSGVGLFGDVMEEVDWSVGQVLAALEANGLDKNTLVIFTSDNGPWLSYGNHAGSAAPLREGKGTAYDGGVRVPMMARWPGKIPPGSVCGEMASTMDLLPTVASLTGAGLPQRKIDGLPITDLLTGKGGAVSPHDSLFFYYTNGELQSMRSANWKLMFPHVTRTMEGQALGKDGSAGRYKALQVGLELYDLKKDSGESKNLAMDQPEILAMLQGKADVIRKELGDGLRGQKPTEARPRGE